MVPLRYRLRSGDTVEVLTSEKQVPGKDWTNYAATARAKSRIRQWLRNRQSEPSRDLGISLIDRELEPVKLSVTQLRSNKRLDGVSENFRSATLTACSPPSATE